jgi:integrase/recombinase XerD
MMRDRVERYLVYLRDEEDYSDNTTAAYRNDLTQFVQWYEGQNNGTSGWIVVRSADMADYLVYLLSLEYVPATVARKMAALKSFFKHLVEAEELVENPAADVGSPRVEKGTPSALSRDGIQRLMDAPRQYQNPKGWRDAAMLELLYATGMRVSELVGLHVEDYQRDHANLCCGTGHHRRIVPITQRALAALQQYLDSGRSNLIRTEEEPMLFLNMRGEKLTRQGLWLIIKQYVEMAGVKGDVTPHTLRHSFAIHRIREGVELAEVQELLGHANISTTQVYTQGKEK